MKRTKFLLENFSAKELKGLDEELKALKQTRNQFMSFPFLDELHEKIRIEKLHRNQARDIAK